MNTDNKPEITLYGNGRVTVGGVDLYVPGSARYEDFHRDETTANILLLGRRSSGKSYAARWQLHRLAAKYEDFKYLVVRGSKPELRRTHLRWLPKELEALGGVWQNSTFEAHYDNGSIGTYAGFDDEKDAMKLLGSEIDALLIEECTTTSWSLQVDLMSCLRTTIGTGRIPVCYGTSNPYGPAAREVYRHYDARNVTQEEEPGYDPRDWRTIVVTAADNPRTNFELYDKRLGALAPQKRRAWLQGDWTFGEGTFFENFEPERNGESWHVIDQLPMIENVPFYRHPSVVVYRVIDWGFADDPACCLWIGVLPDGRAIVFREMTWKRTAAREVVAEIQHRSQDMRLGQTYCDPSMFATKRHDQEVVSVGDVFENNGLALTQSVNDRRLYSVHEYLSSAVNGQPRIQFWREGCETLIRTIAEQRPNKKDPERMADSKTDHHVIALSYFCSGGVTGQDGEKAPEIPWWMQSEAQKPLGHDAVRRHLR